jgi:hypothetical protein
MITLDGILDIICTEAYEYGGIPEVPDHKHGAPQNYSAAKRDARGVVPDDSRSYSASIVKLRYGLELLQEADGKLRWVE